MTISSKSKFCCIVKDNLGISEYFIDHPEYNVDIFQTYEEMRKSLVNYKYSITDAGILDCFLVCTMPICMENNGFATLHFKSLNGLLAILEYDQYFLDKFPSDAYDRLKSVEENYEIAKRSIQ